LEKIMNKSMLAAIALLAGAAIAAPALTGFAADTEPQLAEAGPDRPGIGPRGMGRGGMMMAQMGPGHGMMGGPGSEYFDEHFGKHRGPRGWMHRMMQMSPQQRCEEHLAKRAGVIAYVVAKLNLTSEQKPLWDKLQGILQVNTDKERQLCTGLKSEGARGQETVLTEGGTITQFGAKATTVSMKLISAGNLIRPAIQGNRFEPYNRCNDPRSFRAFSHWVSSHWQRAHFHL